MNQMLGSTVISTYILLSDSLQMHKKSLHIFDHGVA